jgi:hypothetical protein
MRRRGSKLGAVFPHPPQILNIFVDVRFFSAARDFFASLLVSLKVFGRTPPVGLRTVLFAHFTLHSHHDDKQ